MGASSTRVIALAEISEKVRQIEHGFGQIRELLEHLSPGTQNEDTAVVLMLDMAEAHLEGLETFKAMLKQAKS